MATPEGIAIDLNKQPELLVTCKSGTKRSYAISELYLTLLHTYYEQGSPTP